MRKTLRELTQRIHYRVKKHPEIEEFANTIINVEVMAVGCSLIDKNIKLEDAWSLLTGYDEPIIPEYADKIIISRLRIFFAQYSGKSVWAQEIEDYFQIPKKYRLVEINKDGTISFLTPRFDPDRKEEYEKILKEPVPRVRNSLDFAKSEKFTYTRMKENINVSFSGVIPKAWVKEKRQLPEYRKKKLITFDLNFDWLEIAKEIDRQINNGLSEWQARVRPVQLKSRKGKQIFEYKEVQHIAGGLASGKSTFQTINTYWLVTRKKAKVGILEGNVARVLERVREFKAMGINAVPIIGRSDRRRHLEKYLLGNRLQSVTDAAELEALSHLSDVCTIQALAGDLNKERVKHYPCKFIFQRKGKNAEQKKCPLPHLCGFYKDWSKLAEADVWVTTPGAVLYSRIPTNIDPLERLLYEAMYDLLDVIFIDEADQVQKAFDEAFLQEHSAFGNPQHLVEKLLRQLNDTMQGNYDLADNDLLTHWRKNLDHLQESVWGLYAQIKKSPSLRKYLKNQVVYLNYLIYEISGAISKEEEKREEIEDEMRQFVRESNYWSVGNSDERLHGVINVSAWQDKNNLIENWIENIGGVIPENSNPQRIYKKIEFFVYLAHIERAMKFILQFYTVIQNQLVNNVEVPLLTQIRDFRPFMKEAMTGVMLGYRYETKEGQETGDFKIVQYLAVGRQLMHEWATLYNRSDDKSGPGIIVLSGTSYAPKSFHYHLEIEPQWSLQSSRKLSNLTQYFLEIRNPERGEELISVSGVRNKGERQSNLRRIVQELSDKLERELSFWENSGEARKILLLVNSYEDVKVVGSALSMLLQWEGRYRLLSQKDQKDDIWFPRSKIEQFSEEESADILVAPLLAISRGYNIMDKKGEGALFGSVFFLVRPYPVPNDLSYFIQILHGILPVYFNNIEKEGLTYAKAMRKLRKLSRGRFEDMYRSPDYWSLLSREEKTVLAWYTFIPLWQLIGRLMRGGKDARIFYCDAKFDYKPNGQDSMLEFWVKLMVDNESDPLFLSLYGPFADSIRDLKKEGV